MLLSGVVAVTLLLELWMRVMGERCSSISVWISVCILRVKGLDLGECIWLRCAPVSSVTTVGGREMGMRAYGGGASRYQESRLFKKSLCCR